MTMTPEKFQEIAAARLRACRERLAEKNEEYARENNPLHNFHAAAAMNNCTPEEALWGMAAKHIISVRDMVFDRQQGIFPSPEMLSEKIGDAINYLILLEAVMEESRLSAADQHARG